MRREALEKLKAWKDDKNHKPLIVQGARQVGKTWLIKEFGNTYYEKVVYLHFDNNSKLKEIFEKDYDISRLIESFEILSGVKIDPTNTLIIFDEIQECPRALTSLKYFNEEAPQYDIVVAGSLLGLMHHEGTGFPVGKVSFLNLYPMNFLEFVEAIDGKRFIEIIQKKDFEMIKIFKSDLEKLVKMYCYVGGMPEVVNSFMSSRDYSEVRTIQKTILNSYEKDFSKHISSNTVEKIKMLWDSIPSQLAKENKKFLYSLIKEGARAKEYELALYWLEDAGLIYRVNCIKKPSLPLAAYKDLNSFKFFILDVGLLSALTNLDVKTILDKTRLFEEFKGAITEQYVYQQLKGSYDDISIYYWSNDSHRSKIDFIIQLEDKIVPIEVKAEKNLKAKSLKNFIETYNPQRSVRTSLSDYKVNDNNLYDVPLYSIGNVKSIID